MILSCVKCNEEIKQSTAISPGEDYLERDWPGKASARKVAFKLRLKDLRRHLSQEP